MFEALIAQCAVAESPPAIIRQIVEVESGGNPLAIGINAATKPTLPKPKSSNDAIKQAEDLIRQGYNIDLGLMQINSANLASFNISVADVFEPCTNIRIGSEIYLRAYQAARSFYGPTQLAVKTALSAYNTGTFHRGFTNGYVARFAGDTKFTDLEAKSDAPRATLDAVPAPKLDSPFSAGTSIDISFTADAIAPSASP